MPRIASWVLLGYRYHFYRRFNRFQPKCEIPEPPKASWYTRYCVIKIGMKKGKKYFVTDTTIFFTQKLHTSVYINDHALYSFTFYGFYILLYVAFSLLQKSNKQIIFVMKYEVSSYETDKHCLRQIIILQEGSIFICIYHHHIPNVKVN